MKQNLAEIIILKVVNFVFWFWSLLATKPILLDIFPEQYFNFKALIYAFIGNSIFGILELIRKEKEITQGIEGIKPLTPRQFIFIGIRPAAAAAFNFGLNAFIQVLVSIYKIELLIPITSNEGVIFFGLLIGFSFEFINGRAVYETTSKFLQNLLNTLNKGIIKILENYLNNNKDDK